MGYESLEALFVDTSQIVNRETSKRSTYSTQMILIDIGQIISSIVDSSEIILHALTCPVARDFLEPLLSESRQSTTIGCYHHIPLRSHDHEVPTIAPELRNRTLRTTLAEEQSGVLLSFIEVRWQNHPGQHLLTIAGLHPTLLNSGLGQLVENVLVLEGELSNLSLLRLLEVRSYDIEVSRRCEVMTFHQQLLAIVHQVDRSEVIPCICELLQFALPVDGVEVLCSMPNANEIDHRILRVAPNEIINV